MNEFQTDNQHRVSTHGLIMDAQSLFLSIMLLLFYFQESDADPNLIPMNLFIALVAHYFEQMDLADQT